MFKEGDLAVYPAHGVGKIESIEVKKIGGAKQEFYVMRILENDMKIMIPIDNADTVGLRKLIAEDDIPQIYEILKSREISVNGGTWNRRYREYMDKIKTGSLFDVAEVFRDLSILKMTKDLSFGERKLYDTAHLLLVKELAMAKQVLAAAPGIQVVIIPHADQGWDQAHLTRPQEKP